MKILFSLLLLSSIAHADLTLGIGASTGIFGQPGTPFTRVVQAGYQWNFLSDYFVRPELLYYEDLSGGGNQSSFLATLPVGIRALTDSGFELNFSVGPSYLQNPDATLGGHFQFNLEGGGCITDQDTSICLEWHHISSADIYPVNHGRDWPELIVHFIQF